MRNTGMAIAWYFWARHWIEFTILSVICLTAALIFGLAAPGTFGPRAAAATSIFLLPTLATLMVAFSHGLDAKIDGRMTGYPLHWFNLPMPTTALVGWPMFLGALVVAGVWILWVLCILRPSGIPAPILGPIAANVAVLAWLQALTWIPFPFPYARLIAYGVVLSGIIIALTDGYMAGVPDSVLIGTSMVLAGLGCLVNVIGLSRARSGSGNVGASSIARIATGTPRLSRQFVSASQAFLWRELWTNETRVLVALGLFALMMYSINIVTLFVPLPELAAQGFVSGLIFQTWLSGGAGMVLGNLHHSWNQKLAQPTFVLVRPMTTGEIVSLKLRITIWMALAHWMLMLLPFLILAPISPAASMFRKWIETFVQYHGSAAPYLLAALVLGHLALIWAQMSGGMWLSLMGQSTKTTIISLASVGALLAASAIGSWIYRHPEYHGTLWAALPWCLGLLVAAKLSLACYFLNLSVRKRLLTATTVRNAVTAWVGVAIFFLSVALVATPASWLAIVMLTTLGLMPGVGLAMAPLALDWNRHR